MLTQAGCLSRLSYAATYALRMSVSEIGPGIASDNDVCKRENCLAPGLPYLRTPDVTVNAPGCVVVTMSIAGGRGA